MWPIPNICSPSFPTYCLHHSSSVYLHHSILLCDLLRYSLYCRTKQVVVSCRMKQVSWGVVKFLGGMWENQQSKKDLENHFIVFCCDSRGNWQTVQTAYESGYDANDLGKLSCINEWRGRGTFASQLALQTGHENNKKDRFFKTIFSKQKSVFWQSLNYIIWGFEEDRYF